jgi:hypothetical protein
MKTNIKLLLSVVLLGALSLVSAADGVETVSQQLLTAGDKAVQQAMRNVAKEAATLRQSTDGEVAKLGQRKTKQLKQQREVLYCEMIAQKNSLKASLALAQDTYVQTERLRRKTVVAIEKMIEQADKEALKIKTAQRRKIMAAFLAESQCNERMAWKTGLHNEYLEQLQSLEEVVRQGEPNEEYQSFAASFENQRQWFEDQLEQINSSSDKGYFLLFSKVQVLKNIMTSFERVAQMLDERIEQASMVVQDIDKARVLALYDIQALVADKKQPAGVMNEGCLSKRECGLVVEGIFNKLAARDRIDSLMAQANTMQHELLAQQNRQALLNELAEREQQELAAGMERMRNNASAADAATDPDAFSAAMPDFAPEDSTDLMPASESDIVSPPAAIPQEIVVAAVEKVNKENAQLEVTAREEHHAIARQRVSPVANSLAVTSTPPQSLAIKPVLPQPGVPSLADSAEKQARGILESELKQKVARG